MRASDDLAALARRVEPSVVRLDVRGRDGTMASGSGIVYRDDGLVLTSARLVGTGAALDVVLSDGRRLEATLVGRDPLTDVAVVDVDADHLMVAVLGTVEGLEVGAPAVAVGAPTTDGGSLLLAPGMISALERRMEAEPGVVLHGLVQTDAPTAAGAAGGALVDATGSVVALTTAGPAGRGSAFGYAVPIDLVRRVAERIVDQGEMVHPWLGIEGADLSAAEASRLGVAGGALVRSVVAGSPAEQAGLRAGDVITEIDAEAVQSISTVIVALRDHDPGEALAVGYWRAGAHHEATVTVAARPPG